MYSKKKEIYEDMDNNKLKVDIYEPVKQEPNKFDFIENQLIILSKQTIDEFLKQNNPADLISLYTFYYYTAKWQKTNHPKCTDNYIKKGLKWGISRIQNAKTVLKNLGLIQTIQRRDKKGKVIGWYIKMNYLWRNITLNEYGIIQNTQKQQVDETTSGKQETNALSVNNINALSVNNKYIDIFKKILTYWNTFKIYYHKENTFINNILTNTGNLRKHFKVILDDYHEKEIKEAIENYNTCLKSDLYYWSYKWSLWDFLIKGLNKFVNDAEPLKNYLSNKNKYNNNDNGKPPEVVL